MLRSIVYNTMDTNLIKKIERTVSTFSFVNGSINMVFDSNIERYVKVDNSGDPEQDFQLQETNSLSKFQGEIIKALSSNKFFAMVYNLSKTMSGTGRNSNNDNMIAIANDIRSKALTYGLTGCKLTMTITDVPKGTEETYIDPLDGQKKTRLSLRNKRQFEIVQVELDSFSQQLLQQILLK